MAATKEQQRRYQAALRRVLARLRAEQPDTYREMLDEALAAYDARADGETSTRSVGRVTSTHARTDVPDLVAEVERLQAALAWIATNYDSGAGFHAERVLNNPDHERNPSGS